MTPVAQATAIYQELVSGKKKLVYTSVKEEKMICQVLSEQVSTENAAKFHWGQW